MTTEAFNDWLRGDGQKIWSDKAIAAAMRAKGFEKKYMRLGQEGCNCFVGLAIVNSSSDVLF